jgi:predicted amidophosphoribosyltransferase
VKLSRIDGLTLVDHYYLTAEDECYFLREYTPRQGFSYSDTNNLIHNLKKSMDRRGQPGWIYKEQAIRQVAQELRAAWNPQSLRDAAVVPVPPHTNKADPLYDDRVTQIAKLIGANVREIIVQSASLAASHDSTSRPSPSQLRANYEIDESMCAPPLTSIVVLDDMLTAGAHFRAVSETLKERFPEIPVAGVFYARRVNMSQLSPTPTDGGDV